MAGMIGQTTQEMIAKISATMALLEVGGAGA
jgi:hypothetical protein